MPDAVISLRCSKAGFVYVDRGLTASSWDNTQLLDGGRGVLVLGTDQHTHAQAHADAAIRRFFGPGLTAHAHPGPTRWLLFCTSEDRDELEYRPDPDAAEPAVLFTAEEAPHG